MMVRREIAQSPRETGARSHEAGLPRLGVTKGVRPLRGDSPRGLAPLEEWARQDSEPSLRREGGILETVCWPTEWWARLPGRRATASRLVAAANPRLEQKRSWIMRV